LAFKSNKYPNSESSNYVPISKNIDFLPKKATNMNEDNLSLYVLISMMVFLVLSVSIIIFLNQSQHKINKIKLQEKENELLFRSALLENSVKIQEAERNRIATELHDDIGSKLNIIHLNLHLLKKSSISPPDLVIIDLIESSLNASIERTRSLSHELIPQIYKKFGLYHGLSELKDAVNNSQDSHIQIKDEHLLKINDNLKNLHIFRIIQELVQNTIKYGKAKNVTIRFWTEEGNIINLDYTDDGIGFEVDATKNGIGINNIITRAKLLGGNATFTSVPEIIGMKFNLKFSNNG
jgi:two-component system, NarL family, sensor kinase